MTYLSGRCLVTAKIWLSSCGAWAENRSQPRSWQRVFWNPWWKRRVLMIPSLTSAQSCWRLRSEYCTLCMSCTLNQSGLQQISLNSITNEWSVWFLNKFSSSVPYGMCRKQNREYAYWHKVVLCWEIVWYVTNYCVTKRQFSDTNGRDLSIIFTVLTVFAKALKLFILFLWILTFFQAFLMFWAPLFTLLQWFWTTRHRRTSRMLRRERNSLPDPAG